MQRPALTKVRVRPETVQTLGVLDVTETVRSVAVVLAVKVYGNWVLFNVAGGLKVMVCEIFGPSIKLPIRLYLPTLA